MGFKKLSIIASVGIFVLFGVLCLAYLAVDLGKLQLADGNFYEIYGKFDSVEGLKEGASVEIAGVEVGRVARITFDSKTDQARIAMRIRKGVKLTDDVIASVRIQGIIGDKFITLTPGGSDRLLGNNGQIIDTESAIDLVELLKKFIDSKTKRTDMKGGF
jgi:phospholipid/cholesterol/gamma-HCH transport system substrate-binding protein